MRKFGNWSLIFFTGNIMKMSSLKEGLACSDTLVGPRICDDDHLLVRRSKKLFKY